jgi:vacuolar-type H+-ATPase subunit E/Vma4
MSLNKVASEIRMKADKEVQSILGEGRREGDKIIEETKKRLKEYENAMKIETENALGQINMRSQAVMKKQLKDFAMNTKKEMVELVYNEFLDYLKTMKGDERTRIYRKMAESMKSQISKPGVVYVRKDDTALAKKLFSGLKIRTQEMEGGLMLESKDGKEMVDFRFETLVELLKGRTLKSVSRIMFGE